MEGNISKPKVFISYAWGDKDYQNLVLAFASQLVGDGIDVVIDKWDLSEGNDTYAFMEKCANDSSITNVLMLLDPLYAQKADEHKGGVGAETQIISAKVYNEVNQDKFIPIVMKRSEDGSICKPTYLQGRYHFDFTNPETYNDEYKRLVRTLYGKKTYEKPELGSKPSWVDQPIKVQSSVFLGTSELKSMSDGKAKMVAFTSLLNKIKSSMLEFANKKQSLVKLEEYINLYDNSEDLRNGFLEIINNSKYLNESACEIADFFEDIYNSICCTDSYESEVLKIRIHELFIYSVALFLNEKDYHSAGYLLGRTYFNDREGRNNHANSFNMFYSGSYHSNLDNAINNRDQKKYHSGTGQHWIETIAQEYCSKDQFVFADLICYNYSVYGNGIFNHYWFPITYVYCNEYNNLLFSFAYRMESREHVARILPLFGYNTIDEFVKKVQKVESNSINQLRDYRYPNAFQVAPALGEQIQSGKIASIK